MAVQLNNIHHNAGVSPQGFLRLDTRQAGAARGFFDSLRTLAQPRCPDCGKRGMVCRYTVPASYNEPSPRYFACEHCDARYFRMVTGPWFSAAGPQFAQCYEMNLAHAA